MKRIFGFLTVAALALAGVFIALPSGTAEAQIVVVRRPRYYAPSPVVVVRPRAYYAPSPVVVVRPRVYAPAPVYYNRPIVRSYGYRPSSRVVVIRR